MFWDRLWYAAQSRWHYPLIPISWLFQAGATIRRYYQQRRPPKVSVPIVVVGNLTVGGTGKTPLVIALADMLTQQQLKVGIVSRGYGGRAPQYPYWVTPTSDPKWVGDEPLLIAQRTRLPVVVAPDRPSAVHYLQQRTPCDVIISDDGLQHYALPRVFEIVVIDGERGLGNECCLPAGPLRESIHRLAQVDLVVVNTQHEHLFHALRQRYADMTLNNAWLQMRLQPGTITSLCQPDLVFTPEVWRGKSLHAVAAIGHPQRFFQTLRDLNFMPRCHPFADHYSWKPQDLMFGKRSVVVMTEKDAVKCRAWAMSNLWYLPVDAQFSTADQSMLVQWVQKKLTTQ
ncbi:MAG: tetraacyldisaccharide 4'-kinase [Legionellales bacterium]|nr:tetraacyldisaccharide 4'-kinase [Legionellales bacterium]